MRKGYVNIPEGQVHYRTEGDGNPVVLLHQTAFSSDEFMDVIPLLSPYCRAIAMDTMGYGMSDLPAEPYEVEDYARTVRHFMEVLGLKRVTIAGHHTGASIAVEVAATDPGLVERLILSGTPYYDPDMRQVRLADNRFKAWEYAPDGSYIMEAWNKLRRFMPAAGPLGWHRFVTASMLAGPRGEDAHRAVFCYDIEPRLSLIKCPALLLYGTQDTFVRRAEATQKRIAGSRPYIVEGAGPMIAVEQPAKFAQAILEFMGLKQAAAPQS